MEWSGTFIYHIGWDEEVSRNHVTSGHFDNLIRFAGPAGDHLIRLSGLLRPLIEREWTRLVAQFNRPAVPELGLQEFLFGAERINLSPVRGPLLELSENRCFYCDRRVNTGAEVDHFIPWSRYPDNGIENLVIADKRCNGAKKDHLASGGHVERWVDRLLRDATDLAQIASRLHWDLHPERSEGVARSVYLRLPEDSRLWDSLGSFVPLDRAAVQRVFSRTPTPT